MERKTQVFISFSHAPHERTLVEKLIKALHAHQISTCATAEHRTAGANWQREVEQAVKSADAVIVLVDSIRKWIGGRKRTETTPEAALAEA